VNTFKCASVYVAQKKEEKKKKSAFVSKFASKYSCNFVDF